MTGHDDSAQSMNTTDFKKLLRQHDLRPTRQRLLLSRILFSGEHRHVTAEQLRFEVQDCDENMSLATIYNVLNQFSDVGLLRRIRLGNVTHYDTNNRHHHHFYDPKRKELIDIPGDMIKLERLPEVPEGRTIDRIDVFIRLS